MILNSDSVLWNPSDDGSQVVSVCEQHLELWDLDRSASTAEVCLYWIQCSCNCTAPEERMGKGNTRQGNLQWNSCLTTGSLKKPYPYLYRKKILKEIVRKKSLGSTNSPEWTDLGFCNQVKIGTVQLLDPEVLNWGFWSEHGNNSKNERIWWWPLLTPIIGKVNIYFGNLDFVILPVSGSLAFCISENVYIQRKPARVEQNRAVQKSCFALSKLEQFEPVWKIMQEHKSWRSEVCPPPTHFTPPPPPSFRQFCSRPIFRADWKRKSSFTSGHTCYAC